MTLTEDLAVLRTDATRILRRLDEYVATDYQADAIEVYRAIAVIAHEMAEYAFNCVDTMLDANDLADYDEYDTPDDDDEPFYVEPDDGA